MNRSSMLLPLLLAFAGCVTPPSAEPNLRTLPAGAVPPPVLADQVTPQSAHRISQALSDELDREAQQEISAPLLKQ